MTVWEWLHTEQPIAIALTQLAIYLVLTGIAGALGWVARGMRDKKRHNWPRRCDRCGAVAKFKVVL